MNSCSAFPISNGGSGDVYTGRLADGARIAIKVFRTQAVPVQSGKLLKVSPQWNESGEIYLTSDSVRRRSCIRGPSVNTPISSAYSV